MGKTGLRAAICAVFLGLLVAGCSDNAPVVGRQPVQKIRLVEDHSDVLASWAEQGMRDKVVVHIDAHDDIRAIAEPQLHRLRGLVREKRWAELAAGNTRAEGGLYNVGNFLFAAARLGMVKEVYWIVPFPMFIVNDPSRGLRDLLRFCSFPEQDIATFTMQKGCFTGKCRGVPVTVCGIESLPAIAQPVILSIDADFFPEFARAYGTTLVDGVGKVLGACSAKGYRVEEAVISDSVNGGFLKPQQRWLGELCAQMLRVPGPVADAAASRFKRLQQTESALGQGRFQDALVLSGAEAKPADAAQLMYGAVALLELNRIEPALAAASAACEADRRYCFGLPHLGMRLKEAGRGRESLGFFAAGYQKNRTMNLGQADYGFALDSLGQRDAALAAFHRYRALNGPFPIDFVIAAQHIKGGDREQGYRALQTALAGMTRAFDADIVADPVLADAVGVIREFCRENGHAVELQSIDASLLGARLRAEFPSRWDAAGTPAQAR